MWPTRTHKSLLSYSVTTCGYEGTNSAPNTEEEVRSPRFVGGDQVCLFLYLVCFQVVCLKGTRLRLDMDLLRAQFRLAMWGPLAIDMGVG